MDRNLVAAPINSLYQIKRRVVGGATWNYTYDLDGNMTGKTDVQGPGGLDVRYTYDSIGRNPLLGGTANPVRLGWLGLRARGDRHG